LEIEYSVLDQLAAKVNEEVEVEAPTGVGFCMYLRRDALNAVGLFDEKRFGKGYGEENDWCQRAIRAGWRNILAADVFVRHHGSASFRGERAKRVTDAMKILARLHPTYQEQVQTFIKDDPLRAIRSKLDSARLKHQARKSNVLIACHNRGGGTERHVQEDARKLVDEGHGVFFLRPVFGDPTQVRIANTNCRQLLHVAHYSIVDTAELEAALRYLGITRIHSHGLVDLVPEATRSLGELAQRDRKSVV
jgi:dienelactone hydrolase